MKKSKIIVTKRAKKKLIIVSTIIVVVIAMISIFAYLKFGRKTVDVTSHGYESSNNDIESNTFDAELSENEIDENIIEENKIKDNEIVNNTTTNNQTTNKNNNSNGTKYKLEINCTANVVNVYEKDENGDYTKCVKVMLCSVGSATPHSGTYSLKQYGEKWGRWRPLFGDVYGQYATQITGNILFHSVPYTKPNNSNLEYWEYDKLGTSASMGCVRLTVQNAKWIWDNCVSGTKVRFYEDANPGPLGKPTEAKISWNEECRNWDPTDPDKNNPWRNNNQKPNTDKPQETNPPQENNKPDESSPSQGENKPQEGNKPDQGNNTENNIIKNETENNDQSQDKNNSNKNQIKDNTIQEDEGTKNDNKKNSNIIL